MAGIHSARHRAVKDPVQSGMGLGAEAWGGVGPNMEAWDPMQRHRVALVQC